MRELDYLGFNIYIYIILYEKKLYVYRIGLLGLDYFFVKLIPNQNPDFFKWRTKLDTSENCSSRSIQSKHFFFFYNPSF